MIWRTSRYYGITEDKLKSFDGTLAPLYNRDREANVFIGFGSLTNAPEYNMWYQVTQKYDLKYLELAPDLRQQLIQDYKDGTRQPEPFVDRSGSLT